MISRSTVVGGLVVVELAIVFAAASAFAGNRGPSLPFGVPALTVGPGFGAQDGMRTSTPVDKTFLTGPTPHVVVDVPGIHVIVESGTAPTVRVLETLSVHGWVSGTPVQLAAEATPDGVRVRGLGTGGFHVVMGSVVHELRIVVPPTARVQLSTEGDLDVSGLRSKLIAHTSDGHVKVRDQQGDLDASTDDGRIELTDVQGAAIDAVTHDGRIYLTRVGADRLDAHSDSGRIVGTGIRAVDGGLTTQDGRVVVSFSPSSDATAAVHTDDGDISISGFPVTNESGNSRTVRLGSGRGHFELSTADGPITITQGANG